MILDSPREFLVVNGRKITIYLGKPFFEMFD